MCLLSTACPLCSCLACCDYKPGWLSNARDDVRTQDGSSLNKRVSKGAGAEGQGLRGRIQWRAGGGSAEEEAGAFGLQTRQIHCLKERERETDKRRAQRKTICSTGWMDGHYCDWSGGCGSSGCATAASGASCAGAVPGCAAAPPSQPVAGLAGSPPAARAAAVAASASRRARLATNVRSSAVPGSCRAGRVQGWAGWAADVMRSACKLPND